MRLGGSLRARLVVAIALIGLVAVAAAWLASRQVALEEAGVRSRLAGEESGEMARASEAVEELAEVHAHEGGWTATACEVASARLDALVEEVAGYRGYELVDDAGRIVSSFEGETPGGPLLQIELLRETGPIAIVRLYGEVPTPPERQKFVVLQHDTVDLRSPAPRAGLLVASAVAVLTLLLLVGVVLRLTKPLRAMSETVTRFGAGETGARLEVRGEDEIARLGRAFNGMADALEENETRRRNLVNDVAHELRTPLTNLRFRLESVLDGVAQATTEELTSMHADTVRLQRLVEDLQMLSVAEAGGLRLQPRPLELRELVERMAQDAPVSVQNEVPDGTLLVADPDRLEQVLSNLLANAARYAPDSTVRIASRMGRWDEIRCEEGVGSRSPTASRGFESDSRVVSVCVADDGPGIPADALPFVFDRFYRVDASRDRATGGTGLGLAVVRQLVEAQGGCVAVRSEVGAGTEFVLVMPAADATIA